MLKKTMTYKNLDGETITEDFYFNMTKAELMKLEMSDEVEGMKARIERLQQPNASGKVILETFDDILRQSYGVRTKDGKFVKKPEEFEVFLATEAYSDLLFELATDANKASAFVDAIMPADLREEAVRAVENQRNIFEQEQPKIQDIQSPHVVDMENMSEAELLNALGVSNQDRATETITNGLTDIEIWRMSGRELAAQPREVLLRAYQLKKDGYSFDPQQ